MTGPHPYSMYTNECPVQYNDTYACYDPYTPHKQYDATIYDEYNNMTPPVQMPMGHEFVHPVANNMSQIPQHDYAMEFDAYHPQEYKTVNNPYDKPANFQYHNHSPYTPFHTVEKGAPASDTCCEPCCQPAPMIHEYQPVASEGKVSPPVPPQPQPQVNRPNTVQFVHDPYSFSVYSPYTRELKDGEETEEDEEARRRALRRKKVVPPCGHEEYKRLRFKKGLSHFLCTICSTKWKQSGV